MIHPSPEICAVVRRALAAARTLDAETLRGIYSKHDALRYVGSELDEVFGGALFRKGMVDHFAEVHGYDQIEESLEAYESGKFGWALWQGVTIFHDDGQDIHANYRISVVLVLEEGSWKIIQVHVSNPDSVFESLGLPNIAMKALEEDLGLGTSGVASVMFTDVVDSAALADQLGDRLWTDRIYAHLARVRSIVEAADGTLVKSLGDGTMSTFASTRAALTAARDIQIDLQADQVTPKLQLRVGLHTGEVIENKGDFFGTVVNKAARITNAAQAGEIMVSDVTRMLLGDVDAFRFSEPSNFDLKGLGSDHTLYQLFWR